MTVPNLFKVGHPRIALYAKGQSTTKKSIFTILDNGCESRVR